jgi:hypothetical protein
MPGSSAGVHWGHPVIGSMSGGGRGGGCLSSSVGSSESFAGIRLKKKGRETGTELWVLGP